MSDAEGRASRSELKFVDVTLSLDTNIYADGDVLAETQVVTGALRYTDGVAELRSVLVIDEDDQGVALDLLFFDANVSLGTENGAPGISDANSRNILGLVSIAAADFKDLGGARIASLKSVGLLLKAASGTRNVYVAAITRGGTPTYTASGLKLRFGII